MSATVVPFELRSEQKPDFVAKMSTMDLGLAHVSRFSYPSLEALRTPALIRRSDPEVYQLALLLRGRAGVTQGREGTALAAHDFCLQDYSRPARMFHAVGDPAPGRSTAITLTVPRAVLPVPATRLPRHALRIPGRHGVGGLLSQFLDQLTRRAEQYQPDDLARLGTATLDLLSVVLAHHLDTGHALPPEPRDRVLLARVQAHIERHLGDPRLSPRAIADAHHISVRSLHRLFERQQTTVAGWIRTRRLERCRRDLADPAMAGQPVNFIGTRWGFTSPAQFSRAFRSAYGTTPRDYRRLHGAGRVR